MPMHSRNGTGELLPASHGLERNILQ